LYLSRPSEIETVRRLIDARHAQPATEWQKVAHGLPGCNGHAPFIRLHAWKGPKQVADLELKSSALTNKAHQRGDQLLILASDSAYLRFCADCNFWAPGLEVRE
jgi:hypothetical protein